MVEMSRTGRFAVGLLLTAILGLAFAIACGATETVVKEVKVPGETIVVEKEVIKEVMVPGETVIKEVIKEIRVPGETIVVTKEVIKEVPVTVIVEKEVVKEVLVEVPGETVVKTVIKEVMVPGETVIVEVIKEVVKEVRVPGKTIVVEKEVVRIVEVPVMAEGPFGHARIGNSPALGSIEGCGEDRASGATGGNQGFGEYLFTRDTYDPKTIGQLAKSWTYDPTTLTATITLHSGIMFQDGWGEMTAEDLVWNANGLNGVLNPESRNTAAGVFGSVFGAWSQIDKYTVEIPFLKFNSTWRDGILNNNDKGPSIGSKSKFETLGEEKAAETWINSGPFKIVECLAGDKIVGEAVPDHWRNTAAMTGFTNFHIPEESTRIAGLRSGEFDITHVLVLRNIASLQKNDFKFIDPAQTGSKHPNIIPSGNYWERVHFITKEPLEPAPGFKPELPWIGDPADPANKERARLVRWALSSAIDRQTLSDVICGGLCPTDETAWISINDANWDDKWSVPFDPKAAKQMMIDGGYPDGFETNVYDRVAYGPPDVFKSIAGMWREHLGVNVTIDYSSYGTFRPLLVQVNFPKIWVSGCGYGANLPIGWPVGLFYNSRARPSINCGMEVFEMGDFYDRLSGATDPVQQLEVGRAFADFQHHEQLVIGNIEVPIVWAYNPRTVESWGIFSRIKGGLESANMDTLKMIRR